MICGDATATYFASLDPFELGSPVSWAGPEPAPIWLDIAREYTERWHHQQHIRKAVGAEGLYEPHLFRPVLATFVIALPLTYQGVDAATGTTIAVEITGESGGEWSVMRKGAGWELESGISSGAQAAVTLDQDTAWQLFSKGLTPKEAETAVRIDGDRRLGTVFLDAVAIIA